MGDKKLRRKAELESKPRRAWPRWTGFHGMTFRDWLPIVGTFLIPIIIAAGGWWLAWQLGKIEDHRAKNEQAIEEQRAQDESLQAYQDQMSQLMIEHDLRDSKSDSEIRVLARARTLTILERLGPLRKPLVIRFLYESDLINREHRVIGLEGANLAEVNFTETNAGDPQMSTVDLRGADFDDANMVRSVLNTARLRGVHMLGTHLEEAELRDASLPEADLSDAWLGSTETIYNPVNRFKRLGAADLRGANLTDATLQHAFMHSVNMSANEWGPPTSRYPEKYRDLDRTELTRANLHSALLWQADLRGAILDDADFTNTILRGATLNGAGLTGPQHSVDFSEAKLDYANFTGAILTNANFSDVSGEVAKSASANFSGARLDGANFTGARLDGANFTDATLEGADFTDAQGITSEQLKNQADTLEGTIMPNGQKYEE